MPFPIPKPTMFFQFLILGYMKKLGIEKMFMIDLSIPHFRIQVLDAVLPVNCNRVFQFLILGYNRSAPTRRRSIGLSIPHFRIPVWLPPTPCIPHLSIPHFRIPNEEEQPQAESKAFNSSF